MARKDREWWETMFDTDWIKIFAYKNRDARKEAIAIRTLAGLPIGSKILDVACGDGRISLALARMGYKITGLDTSKTLLDSARRKAKRAKLDIQWILGDMKRIGIDNQFDAAINVFTSFGYFQNDNDNLNTLNSISRALKKAGRLILDLENIFFIARGAQISGGEPMYRPIDNYKGWVEETTRFNTYSQRVEMGLKLWFPGEGIVKEGEASYRVFTVVEIKQLLEEAGLSIHGVYGDFNLSKYEVHSERMILLCLKSP